MSEADAVWFIGYSFPESDSFMRYFFAGALRDNTRLRQIVIIDPDAISLAQRTSELFGSSEHSGLVELLPLPWEEAVP